MPWACGRVPKRGGGARGASGYREVAISGSFAMNRFHFIVLPLPFAIFLSTILRLCIFLSFIFFFGALFNFPAACNSAYA